MKIKKDSPWVIKERKRKTVVISIRIPFYLLSGLKDLKISLSKFATRAAEIRVEGEITSDEICPVCGRESKPGKDIL